MHDFLLAKEIIQELEQIVQKKGLNKPKSVDIEIGSITLTHDGIPEHAQEINLENLKFGLKSIAKNTILKDTLFKIKKTKGDDWKIVNIETD